MAITPDVTPDPMLPAGMGLRLPHIAEVVATRPPVGWLEVHPENFLANPHATELLIELARHYPVSVHTVGVSVGSADGIDAAHLERVAALVDRLDPMLVSGHLAWSTHRGVYLNDLLPLPYTGDTLSLVCDQLARVQDRFGRPYVVENPSTYVGFTHSTMSEVEFLNELVARTGCRILCDVSNIVVSGFNMGFDPFAYLAGLPAGAVAELHLGGFTREDDEATPGATLLIDTHATGVDESVWPLYRAAVRRFPGAPTLVEWDNDLPALDVVVHEVGRADAVRRDALEAVSAGRR